MKHLLFLALVSFGFGKSLYVSTTGSDAVTYASNGIGAPWLTFTKCFQGALAGDTCFYRGGTYTISSTADNRLTGNNGTAASRITHTRYQSEAVTINANVTGGPAILVERPYVTISYMNFTGNTSAIRINQDGASAKYAWVHDCTFTANTWGDNIAPVSVNQEQARGARVFNNTMNGPGRGTSADHAAFNNTAGIIVFRCDSVYIYNNKISNFPNNIYMKHGNESSNRAGTDIRIERNWILNGFRDNLMLNTQFAVVRNNIIVADSSASSFHLFEDGGRPTGDSNTITHNTFHCAANKICWDLNYQTGTGDISVIGTIGNVIQNNVFTRTINISRYSAVAHGTTLNYNLHSDSSIAFYYHNGSSTSQTASFTGYRTFYGQSVNSVAGKPVFTGGASPSTVAGFLLSASSPGENVASDGLDMGAMVDSVGPPTGLPSTPVASPVGATFTDTTSVSLSSTGTSIRYTTNGATPTGASTLYSAAISVPVTTTIKAIAFDGVDSSAVMTEVYTITLATPAAPTASPVAGAYGSTQNVTLSTVTGGTSIRYTIDGVNPTASTGDVYSGAITISATSTLRAIAVLDGRASSVLTAAYTITAPAASSGAAGGWTGRQRVKRRVK